MNDRKYCFYFNKNNNFYETLNNLPSECEINQAEHRQFENKESSDSQIPLETSLAERNAKITGSPKPGVRDYSDWQLNPEVAARRGTAALERLRP
jgi:hypothetical protein